MVILIEVCQSEYCELCLLPYNFILHFENLAEEEKYIIQVLGAESVIFPRWENVNDNHGDENLVDKYFSMLDQEDIDKLYHIYKEDFEMLGYEEEVK